MTKAAIGERWRVAEAIGRGAVAAEQALDCGGHCRAHHDMLRVAVLVDALDDAFHGHGEGATKKNRSETTTNTDEVWTRRGREFKQAGSLSWSSE